MDVVVEARWFERNPALLPSDVLALLESIDAGGTAPPPVP